MNLQQIFKAINLRITTSKQSTKTFYGLGCREFIFEDCYQNEVGSFFVVPDGDVCEVILNATVKDLESGEKFLTYKWINKKFEEKRTFALSKMSRSEYNKEEFVYANYAYEKVASETIMLGMIQKISEGGYLNNVDIQEEALTEEAFLELSKVSYRKDISVKKLIADLIDSGLTFAELNEKFGNKTTSVKTYKEERQISKSEPEHKVVDKETLNTRKTEDVKNEDVHVKTVTEATVNFHKDDKVEIESNERETLRKLPDYINGTFEIGKGFVRRENVKTIRTFDEQEMSLKDRINPKPIIQTEHLVRYPGDKTVLSNLKQKKLVN